MGMIKGIPVTLYVRTKTGEDDFGRPVYSYSQEAVNNVLVSPVSEAEALSDLNLTGSRTVYQLGIPKGDAHDWKNATVGFFGEIFRQTGDVIQGIEEMIPLEWNKKIRVERINE